MGVLRSCYSCPVFWRPGQVEPDQLIWYWSDRCAGKFPFRHTFASHYQTDDFARLVGIGEQPGPRFYSKGGGPIGAARSGLVWNGDLEWFVNGVPQSAPASPTPCRTTLAGTVPFPPPDSWTDILGVELHIPYRAQPSYVGEQTDSLSWHFENSDPEDYELITADWTYESGYGMRLSGFVVAGGGPPDPPDRWPQFAFVSSVETTTTITYHYQVSGVRIPGVQDWYITVVKCT